MNIEWTTVIASGVVAAIISSIQFVTTRYLSRILDRLERTYEKANPNGKKS